MKEFNFVPSRPQLRKEEITFAQQVVAALLAD